jgi:hypothetical protein
MTLTAPGPVLPVFGTVVYEPALEPPDADLPALDGGWAVQGDPPPASEETQPPTPEVADPVLGRRPKAEAHDGTAAAATTDRAERSASGGGALPSTRTGPAGDEVPRTPPPGSARRERERALAARRRAELVVRTALEVLDGRRPVTQLAPFAAPPVLRYVSAGVPRRGHGAATGASLRSLHVSLPARTAAEVAAVCRFGTRFRALAARLELTGQGEWRCVALRVV